MRCRNEVKSGVMILAGKWPARKRRTWKNIKEGGGAMMMVEMLVMMVVVLKIVIEVAVME